MQILRHFFQTHWSVPFLFSKIQYLCFALKVNQSFPVQKNFLLTTILVNAILQMTNKLVKMTINHVNPLCGNRGEIEKTAKGKNMMKKTLKN